MTTLKLRRLHAKVISIKGSGSSPDDPTPTQYTVTFNANGGTSSVQQVQVGQNSTLENIPLATRDEYSFLGWYDQMEGGNRLTSQTEITEDRTYYAHWTQASGGRQTVFTMDNGEVESYDIEGQLDQQFLLDNGFISVPRRVKGESSSRGIDDEQSNVVWIKPVSSISIGSGVDTVQEKALANCPTASITLPGTISYIPSRFFWRC